MLPAPEQPDDLSHPGAHLGEAGPYFGLQVGDGHPLLSLGLAQRVEHLGVGSQLGSNLGDVAVGASGELTRGGGVRSTEGDFLAELADRFFKRAKAGLDIVRRERSHAGQLTWGLMLGHRRHLSAPAAGHIQR